MYYVVWFIINVIMFFCGSNHETPVFWIVQAILLVGSFLKKRERLN